MLKLSHLSSRVKFKEKIYSYDAKCGACTTSLVALLHLLQRLIIVIIQNMSQKVCDVFTRRQTREPVSCTRSRVMPLFVCCF